MVVILDKLLGRERHLMHGTVEIIDDFWCVRLARDREFPSGIGVDMARIRNRGGIPPCQEERPVDRVGGGIEVAGQSADAVKKELSVPVRRKHRLETSGIRTNAVAGSYDGTLHVAILRVGRSRRHIGSGRDGHIGDAQSAQRGHRAIRGPGWRYADDTTEQYGQD